MLTASTDTIECPLCHRAMRSITTQHIRTHGYTDAKSFKRAFGLDTLKCSDMREKQAAFMSANNPTAGGHLPESIQKMRDNRCGKGLGVAGKYTRTLEIRDKIAVGVLLAWENGKRGRGKYIYGRKIHRKVWVRSSWEERVVRVLDLHPCVESYELEPLQIPYPYEGHIRRYVPDFLVCLEGGIQELWEVKPEELVGHPRNEAKMKALNEYVRQHGLNARLVTLEHIEGMEQQVGLRNWVGPGAPWVRPEDPDYRPTLNEIRGSTPTPEA